MSDQQKSNGQLEQPQNARLFNPNEHLMQIKSRAGAADYLPVQWRLVWFRSLCPNGTIETEIVHLDLDRETEEEAFQWNNETRRSEKVTKRAPGFAVCRATVKDGRGGVATGTKSEKAASFGDFLEKAETGAIGRALAALGYGTQFTGEEFDERHRIVDSPVAHIRSDNESRDLATPTLSDNKSRDLADRATGLRDGDRATGIRDGDRANGIRTPDRGAASPSLTPVENNSNGNGQRPAAINRTSSRTQAASKAQAAEASEVNPNAPMSDQQWTSIRKLCQHLGKAEPQQTDTMNYLAAKELLAQLTHEYRQSRSKAS